MTNPDDALGDDANRHWWLDHDTTAPQLHIDQPGSTLDGRVEVDPTLYDDGLRLTLRVGSDALDMEYRCLIPWTATAEFHQLLGRILAAHARQPPCV